MKKKYKQTSLPYSDMGVGYSSDKTIVTGISCLNNYKTDLIGQPKSLITFGDAKTASDMTKDLGLGLSVSAMVYPRIIGSVAISYAKYIQESKYSQVFNFLYQLELGQQVLKITDYGEKALNPFGLEAYQAGLDQFRLSCGDKFVVEQALGARLYLTMKLTFASAQDKTSFGLTLGGKLDLLALTIEVKLKFQEKIAKENINLNIEIAAYQSGGDVIRLARIFNQDTDGTYYVMSCDVRSMDACQQILSGVINYAKSDFLNQISYENGTLNGYPNVLGSAYMSYTDLGLKDSQSSITDQISQMRGNMLQNYTLLTQEKEFLENLLYTSKFQDMQSNTTAPGYKKFEIALSTIGDGKYNNYGNVTEGYWTWSPDLLFIEMQLTLTKLLNNIASNILLLESKDIGILNCYQNPVNCQIPDMAEVDHSTINLFKKAYQLITVCDNKGYGRYILPVDKDIYKEQARFDLGGDIISSENMYLIQSVNTTKNITFSVLTDELTRNSISCGSFTPHQESELVAVYEGDVFNECAQSLCPAASGGLYAYLILVEGDTPL